MFKRANYMENITFDLGIKNQDSEQSGSFSVCLANFPNKIVLHYPDKTITYHKTKNEPIEPQEPENKTKLGSNISPPSYWQHQHHFVNVFMTARPWMTQTGKIWDTKEQEFIEFDDRGYPLALNPDERDYDWLGSTVSVSDKVIAKENIYVLLYNGEGELEYHGKGIEVIGKKPGRHVLKLVRSGGLYLIKLMSTNPENHLRDIRLVPQSKESLYKDNFHPQNNTFTNEFKEVFKPLAPHGVRFMDWQETNNSPHEGDVAHSLVSSQSFLKQSLPIPYLVQFANELNIHPWFCFSHLASERAIKNQMQYIKENLNSDLTPYFEISNEVWNGKFEQSKYFAEQGKQMGINKLEAYAIKVASMSVIASKVYDKSSQYNIVLGAQAANIWTLITPLEYLDKNYEIDIKKYIDFLGIAPYFGGKISRATENANILSKWAGEGERGIEKFFDQLIGATTLPESYKDGVSALENAFDNMRKCQEMSDGYEIPLIAYEGGQHLVMHPSQHKTHPGLIEYFREINNHPQMKEVYNLYLNTWNSITNYSPFFHFSDMGRGGRWGYWGAALDLFDFDTPKYQALVEFGRGYTK